MSWLSDRLGIHLGNVGAPIGALIGSVVPGVGTSIGAALGQGLGALGQGKNVGQAALEGAGTYGVGKLAGAVRKLGSGIPGEIEHGGITGRGMSGGESLPTLPEIDGDGHVIPRSGGVETFGGVFPEATGDGGGSWQDVLKSALGGGIRKLGSGILNTVTGQPGGVGLGDLATGGLAAYQAYNAAKASQRAGQMGDKAINLAESRWNDAAPLRTAGQARLLNPVRPQLDDVFTQASNPFAVRKLKGV